MIPVHLNHVSGRYSNMYASHHRTSQHLQYQQQQPSVMWSFVPTSIVTPNSSLPLMKGGGYRLPHPPGLAMVNRRGSQGALSSAAAAAATNRFVAISPSMPPLSLVNQARFTASSIEEHSAPSLADSAPSSSLAASAKASASGKGNQNEEYEAAEVLLGLTTRDDREMEKVQHQQHSPKKSTSTTDASAASSIKKAAPPMGHVTDESSIGTASPTPPLLCTDDPANWFSGSISLSLPEDDDVLSPLHCFMRKYCVEAFSASAQDVATPRYGKSHGFKVEVGQVGIRCIYCKNLPVGKRPERAVCYPSSLRNIYHSIETWQRRHSLVCTHISPWVRKSIEELMESSKTRAGGRRQYWEDSAKRLGMVDTTRGVRFIRPPGDLGQVQQPQTTEHDKSEDKSNGCRPLVLHEDKDLVTDYLFLLMEQMQTCYFTEEDRTGGRSKIKNISLNYPGYECRHCHGRAGFGRYFPTSVAALSLANSDRNVFNHLQKCRRCPAQIKKELIRLSKEQAQSKNRRGLRKLFFGRIWDRMHEPSCATWSFSAPTATSPAVLAS